MKPRIKLEIDGWIFERTELDKWRIVRGDIEIILSYGEFVTLVATLQKLNQLF